MENELIDIAPFLRPRVGAIDLIRPEATFSLVLGYGERMAGRMFLVSSRGFRLELSCDGERVIFTRNDSVCVVDLAKPAIRSGKFLLIVLWSFDRLMLRICDQQGDRQAEKVTSRIAPPNSLLTSIRKYALAEKSSYADSNAFFEEVVAQLQILTDRIYANNALDLFWDTIREGQKIIDRVPKRETEIHPSIRQFLDPMEVQRGWIISPEYPIGSGKLDFLFSARLSDGKDAHVCVEFKLAHSADLAHGLFVQLPEYMDRKCTDYGLYSVINFGGIFEAKINQFGLKEFRDPESSLDLALPIAANNTGRPFVRALIIDVSRPPPPSKM